MTRDDQRRPETTRDDQRRPEMSRDDKRCQEMSGDVKICQYFHNIFRIFLHVIPYYIYMYMYLWGDIIKPGHTRPKGGLHPPPPWGGG